mgnify:CR=1 FL=1
MRQASLILGESAKRPLELRSPVLPAAGFLGYGRSLPQPLSPTAFGALVTRVTTLRPVSGLPLEQQKLRHQALAIYPLPPPNPGIAAVLREFGPTWRQWPSSIVLALYGMTVEELAPVALMAARFENIGALELHLPVDADGEWLREVLPCLQAESELPVLVKLPLSRAAELAPAAEASGAAALVLGTPHCAALETGLSGPAYGPWILPYTFYALQQTRRVTALPLIASGGICSLEAAEACLRAGAVAVQLDVLLVSDPEAAAAVAQRLPSAAAALAASG